MIKQRSVWGQLVQLSLGLLAMSALNAGAADVHSIFTVQAPEGKWMVRALTSAMQCPAIVWDQQKPVTMQIRAPQAVVPARSDGAQSDSKPSVFDLLIHRRL